MTRLQQRQTENDMVLLAWQNTEHQEFAFQGAAVNRKSYKDTHTSMEDNLPS
jgi:hypothetical protein